MTTKEIAERLVALCRAGKNIEAVETLMSADVVSVEAQEDPSNPDGRVVTGLAGVKGKNEWWVENHVIHSSEVRGPYPHEDRFTVIFNFLASPKTGPMAGKTMRMEEAALYTVADGKIVREEFFYDMADMTFEDAKPAARKGVAKKKAAKKAVTKKASRPAAKTTSKAAKTKTKTKTQAKAKTKAKPKSRKR